MRVRNKGELFNTSIWLNQWFSCEFLHLDFLLVLVLVFVPFYFILSVSPSLSTQTSQSSADSKLLRSAGSDLLPFLFGGPFNWAVCQKAWPAWVIEAFMYLHSWHSLCISSVGWGFPGPCTDAQRRTNRMFATQEWMNASDSSAIVGFIYNSVLISFVDVHIS